jgi:hypothetical protein
VTRTFESDTTTHSPLENPLMWASRATFGLWQRVSPMLMCVDNASCSRQKRWATGSASSHASATPKMMLRLRWLCCENARRFSQRLASTPHSGFRMLTSSSRGSPSGTCRTTLQTSILDTELTASPSAANASGATTMGGDMDGWQPQ